MKVLIVGYGSVAVKHHDALLRIDPAIEVIALRNSPFSKELGNILSVFTYDEAKKHAPYSFAIISNPTYKHTETIDHLLDMDCPLFIEKPLSDNLGCDELLDRITSLKLITYVACNLRFLDSLIYLKDKLIKDVVINEVNVYCGSYLPEWRPGSDFRSVYSSDAKKGGGVHLDLIHELDYVYWLFGKPVTVRSFKSSSSTLSINAPDYANYLLVYRSFAVNVILNYFRKDKKRCMELVCEDGTYEVDLLSNTVIKDGEELFKSEQKITDTYYEQMGYFINVALKRNTVEKIMNDAREAFEVLKITIQ